MIANDMDCLWSVLLLQVALPCILFDTLILVSHQIPAGQPESVLDFTLDPSLPC
jgi:hypothetical protein